MLAVGVAGIAVGVVLHGELAVGRLHVGVACGAHYAQDLVVVALAHASVPKQKKRRVLICAMRSFRNEALYVPETLILGDDQWSPQDAGHMQAPELSG